MSEEKRYHNLGFPRTIDEVKAELLEAETAWDDDSQWSTSEEMRAEIKHTFPWANVTPCLAPCDRKVIKF